MDTHKLPRFLFPRQVAALLAAPDPATPLGCRDRAILELLYASGLRRSELVTLQLRNIDLAHRHLRVIGKGDKERDALFGEPAALALDDYICHARPAPNRNDDDTCFLSRTGRPLAASYLWTLVRRYALRAGLPRCNPHALRHTCATHMLEGGADLRHIQELLGHTHVTTTEIYLHTTTARLKEVYASAHPLAQIDPRKHLPAPNPDPDPDCG